MDLLLKSLEICEKIGYKEYLSRLYNSIGNVYSSFKDYETSKKYYFLAFNNIDIKDFNLLPSILNNIGTLYSCTGKYDSAVYYLGKTCKLLGENNTDWIFKSLSNIGLANHRLNRFDEALKYYRKGLNRATFYKNNNGIASLLSNIGQLYFDMEKLDSARYYLNNSNKIAENNNNLLSVIDNYKYLTFIEQKDDNHKLALDYNLQYMLLNDSIYNLSKYSNINQKQFVYEMSKIDKQMKEISAEQILKENKIAMQFKTQVGMALVICIALLFLIILIRKNRILNVAYNKLVDCALEAVNIENENKLIKQKYEQTLKLLNEKTDTDSINTNKEIE